LTRDDFEVLVIDVDALQTVDFLNLVDRILLQSFFAADIENVVRVAGAIHQRIAGHNALVFLHVDMDAAGQRVFALLAIVANDVNLALALGDFAVADHAVDLGHDRAFTRLARFEEFDDTRQTAGDVPGLGGSRGILS
jgi:hypothetical protein